MDVVVVAVDVGHNYHQTSSSSLFMGAQMPLVSQKLETHYDQSNHIGVPQLSIRAEDIKREVIRPFKDHDRLWRASI